MPDRTVAADVVVPLAAGVVAGGIVGAVTPLAGAAVVVAGLAGASRGRGRWILGWGAVGLAVGGVGVAVAARPAPPRHLVHHAGPTPVQVEGGIVASAVDGERCRLVVRGERVGGAGVWRPVQGRLAVTIAHATQPWPVGTRVRVRARLRRPRNFGNPGGSDYAGTLARRGVRVTAFAWDDTALRVLAPAPRGGPRAAREIVRQRVRTALATVGDPGAAAFLRTVLLGEQAALGRAERRVLARSGLAHVASVSGFHVAVVAGASVLLFGWCARRSVGLLARWDVGKLAIVAALPVVLLYGALAGGRVPATRALLMYGAVVGARLLDRPTDPIRALAAAALVVLLPVPTRVRDIAFALSFMSVLAIVAALRPLARRETGGRMAALAMRLILEPARVTVAASLATAPLMARYFQEVSLVAPLANVVALPLLGPGVLLPGLAALPLAAVAPALAAPLLAIAATAAGAGLRIAAALARPPWAAIATPQPSPVELVICYAALAVPFLPRRLTRAGAGDGDAGWPLRRWVAVLVALAVCADVGFWTFERHRTDRMRVTFLSVGQGDAAVVELPGGHVMVIDGGGLPGAFDPGERIVAPFLRARKIGRVDVVVLSHPQHDHYEGLAHLVERFRAREFWSTGAVSSARGFARLQTALARAGTRRVVLRAGQVPWRDRWVRIEVLHPAGNGPALGSNDGSLVLRVAHDRVSVLFTGDVEARGEAHLLRAAGAPRSTVLKVAHHGSRTSSSAAVVRAVAPRAAVVSVGDANRFGFPAPEVLARLAAVGAEVWRTDRDGAVTVVSDGRTAVVHGWRAPGSRRVILPDIPDI
jgi:competence protein ComEC